MICDRAQDDRQGESRNREPGSKSCEIVLDAFRRIREGFDATVIVASHDPLLYDHIEKKFFLFDGRLKTGPDDST